MGGKGKEGTVELVPLLTIFSHFPQTGWYELVLCKSFFRTVTLTNKQESFFRSNIILYQCLLIIHVVRVRLLC